ncbi:MULTISPECIES: restriction endonuclease subunit S [unclassified Vibrio]|uniref:restriction endonuclease subunit S n=1 Tax=unclassified Vibrio TaxID=2614977 RepID=UPI00202B1CBA|nr:MULTISPECIES: restriction endonuclease subunit S [unclassified Vibrio]MDW3169264.1 restriction endonuclease subunit S [Vibrio sp. Y184]URQ94273.1 restriction endonuclease subunit S [Vibrio sp. SCSIO 43097]
MKTELLKKLGRINTIPAGWKLTTVGKVCKIRNDLRKPLSTEERAKIQGAYPYYGPTGVLDFIDHHLVEGLFALIGEDGDHFLKPEQKAQTLLVNGKFNVNNHAHLIQGTEKCSSEWFFLYFHHRDITHLISRQGASRYKLNKDTLSKLPILVPPLNEQLEIYKLFTTWHNAIEKTEALIAAKEKQFEWLRSHLISSSRTNQTLKFGDFLTESRIPDTTQDPERRLTVRLHLKGVSVRDYRGTESTDATKYFHRKSGQLIYGKQNVFRGSIGIVPSHLDGYSSSQDIPAFDIADNVNSKWLYWYLSRPSFYSWLENFSAGSGSKRLHPKELFKISVDLPTLEDQKRISDSLNLADKEIRLLKKTLEQYRSQKRGLMQKLLTGEWQVTSAQVGAEGELQDRTKENVA